MLGRLYRTVLSCFVVTTTLFYVLEMKRATFLPNTLKKLKIGGLGKYYSQTNNILESNLQPNLSPWILNRQQLILEGNFLQIR